MENIKLYLTLSIVVLVLKLVLNFKDPWNVVLIFYFSFSLGTVINFLVGNPIYFGIVPAYIPQATQIFFVALTTSALTAFFFRNRDFLGKPGNYKIDSLITLNPLLMILIVYAVFQILMILSKGSLSKVEKISLLNPSLHYPYLLLQTFALSFFHVVKKQSFAKSLILLNGACYLAYCLTTGERDFIFPLCSIVIHLLIIKRQNFKNLILYSIGLFGMIAGTVAIFFLRDSTQKTGSLIEALFNQGSILFINTNVLKFLETSIDHFNGYSYLNSFINLLPSFIYKTDFNTVNWFKDMYAAQSTSGYGFALDAEGYLNFGMWGVIGTFFIITFIHRLVFNSLNRQPIFLYFSTFYLSFIMYALRNDSLAFFKGSLYAVLFFFFIVLSSKIISNLSQGRKRKSN